jgi:excisionase family DNA binding protein
MDCLLTVKEVANILRVSDDTVVRLFARVEGVIDLGSPETRRKRRCRVLRIAAAIPFSILVGWRGVKRRKKHVLERPG